MTVKIIPVQFTASRVGVNGLPVTWDIDRVTKADSTVSAVVTDGANVGTGRRGVYFYSYDMDLTLYDYIVTAKSTSAIVDMKELTTVWTEYASDVTVNSSVAVTAANAATLAVGNVAFTSYAHNSMAITSTSTEDLASATKVWFALKDSYLETDAQSLVFIEKTLGLTYVGKAAIVSPIVAGDGSLTVSGSSGAWVFTVVLKSEAAALLAEYAGSGKLGEVKATIGGLDKVIGTVTGAINSGVIRAVA
jgi:hypothetical protein